MEMHAYSEDYLLTAQRILGDMLDYAVNEYEFDPDEFYKMFLVSDVSRQFQEGNPTYIAGKNGCEIVKEVIRSAGLIMEEIPDEMYLGLRRRDSIFTNWKRVKRTVWQGIQENKYTNLSIPFRR